MSNNLERLSEILDGQRWQGMIFVRSNKQLHPGTEFQCRIDLCIQPWHENPVGFGKTMDEALGKAIDATIRLLKPKPKPVLPGLELPKPKLTLPGF